jgi:hypothetical protein
MVKIFFVHLQQPFRVKYILMKLMIIRILIDNQQILITKVNLFETIIYLKSNPSL